MPPRTERRRSDDFAKNAIFFLLDDGELDQAVVDQHGVADIHVASELVVIDLDRFLLDLFRVTDRKLKDVAFF